MVGTIESGKDTTQQMVESTVLHVGNVATIITGTIADTVHEIGAFLSESIEAVLGVVESAVNHVGKIAVIITASIARVIGEIGDLATEGFEMVEASRMAHNDRALGRPTPALA